MCSNKTTSNKRGRTINPVPLVRITERDQNAFVICLNTSAVALFPENEVVVEEYEESILLRRPTMMDNNTKSLTHHSISYISPSPRKDLSGIYQLISTDDSEVFALKPVNLEDVGKAGPNRADIEYGNDA